MEGTRKVLVVDDEPDIAEVLQAHLEIFDYSADVANNGDEGLDKLLFEKYRFVITDMNYKNNIGPIIRDGIHFGIAVRSTGNQIPLILSSGTMQNLEEFLGRYNMSREDGNRLFCAYLPKPFLKDDLRRAIDKAEYSLRTTPQPQ